MFPLSYYRLILFNICNWIFFFSVVQMCVLLELAAALLMWCHCVCVVPGSGLSDVAGRGSQSDGGDTWGPQRSQEILETAEVSSIKQFECERTELKNEHSSSTSAVVYYATYCRLFFYFEQKVTIEICLLHFSFLLLMLISITVWLCFFGMNQNKIFLLSLVKFWFVLFM